MNFHVWTKASQVDKQDVETSSVCRAVPVEVSVQDVCDTLQNGLVLPRLLDVGLEVLHNDPLITSLTRRFCHPFDEKSPPPTPSVIVKSIVKKNNSIIIIVFGSAFYDVCRLCNDCRARRHSQHVKPT